VAYRTLYLLLALPALACCVLPRASAQSDPDPVAVLRPALVKMAVAARSKTRFTYFDLNHTMNFDEKGRKISDLSKLSEVTYIGNLQYSRLVQTDDGPLRGKELAAEQRRYDDAVRAHAGLNDAAQSNDSYTQLGSYGINLTASGLASQYRSTLAGAAALPFCECIMIDSTPLSGAPQRKYRMWVDPAKQQLLRLDSTLLADDGQDMKGGILTIIWTYIGDTPLISKSHFDVNVRLTPKKSVHVIADHTYLRYRKFSATTTIVSNAPADKNKK
jgi:hypothetical protein